MLVISVPFRCVGSLVMLGWGSFVGMVYEYIRLGPVLICSVDFDNYDDQTRRVLPGDFISLL